MTSTRDAIWSELYISISTLIAENTELNWYLDILFIGVQQAHGLKSTFPFIQL